MQGLSVSRVVDVDINFAPQAIPALRFDTLLIMGDSTVITAAEGIREYNSIAEVVQDFGTTAPEYQGAVSFFAQSPQPDTLFIGRWFRTAGAAVLLGGDISSYEQSISRWQAVTNGSFVFTADGAAHPLSGLDFSSCQNLNAVAYTIQQMVQGVVPNTKFVFNGSRFSVDGVNTTAGASLAIG